MSNERDVESVWRHREEFYPGPQGAQPASQYYGPPQAYSFAEVRAWEYEYPVVEHVNHRGAVDHERRYVVVPNC